MRNFVNRETELRHIEETFNVLLEDNGFVRKRIVEFYGVGGIGKTTILKRIEQHCRSRQVRSIWTDASRNISEFSREIVSQVQQYDISFPSESSDLFDQSITATKALLKRGPLVLLIDSLDAADEEQLAWIERMLINLVEEDKLLAVLASKKVIPFDRALSVARRLAHFSLKPFNHDSYIAFLDGLEQHIDADMRDIIFQWTYGYPLALNVMIQAIQDHGLNPRVEQDQKLLLSIVIEQVIVRGVLANVPQTPDELQWYQTMLTLFSVPRYCNLVIIQKIVERFAPDYIVGSSLLAYRNLPTRINKSTDVINWNLSRPGFSVEPSIRHIFLLKLQIEEQDRYIMMHRFLAATDRQLADKTNGTDRVHYLQEYLYHCANCEQGVVLQQTIQQVMLQVIEEPYEIVWQFHEDFLNDYELKTALGRGTDIVISSIYRQLSRLNQQAASDVTEPEEKFNYLHDFLYYAILDPIAPDLVTHLVEAIRKITAEESREICYSLYSKLLQDGKIKEKLGANISVLAMLLVP